jgi:hypothetical protein
VAIKLIDLKEKEAALIELDDREAVLDDREEDLHDRETELHDREAELSSKEDNNVSKSMRLEACPTNKGGWVIMGYLLLGEGNHMINVTMGNLMGYHIGNPG